MPNLHSTKILGDLRVTGLTNLNQLGPVTLTGQLTSTVATGTAPFVIASTTAVANLNADLVDGLHASSLVQTSGAQTIAGVKTFSDNMVLSGDLAVNGGDITTSSATFNIGNTATNVDTILKIGAAATSGSGVVKTIEIGTNGVNNSTTLVSIGSQNNGSTQILSASTYIEGDLYIAGTTTTINTQTLNIADNIITLNSDFTSGDMPTENAGIEVLRGTSANGVSLI